MLRAHGCRRFIKYLFFKYQLIVVFQETKKQTSSPNLEPKEDSKTTVSPSKKRRPSSEQPWGNALRGMTSHFLDRWQQVVVMKLRTGHSRLNALMFSEMKLATSPTCNYDLEDQTAEHILQRCPLLQTARQNVWSTAVQLDTKLYGSKEELEKTATFILQIGLSV